jgi:aspartyl-tRNA(Asn)/glutamyl-tRNA(Gln) amidotransferase subunit B
VRLKGAEKLGTKAEVKNLNSFRFLKMALDYEIARQVSVLEAGGRIEQETRLYNVASGETVGMRSKEHAHDYRYFPEPDLVPLRVSDQWRERVRAQMPELPARKRERFMVDYKLTEYDANWLTADRAVSEYFEGTAAAAGDPKAAANWIMGDLAAALKAAGKHIGESPVTAQQLGELIRLKAKGDITGKQAKEVFARMFATGDSPAAIVEHEGMKSVSDTGDLEKIIDDVIAANPKQVEQYRGGKSTVLGFFVGQVMKASRGQANPSAVNELLRKKLAS